MSDLIYSAAGMTISVDLFVSTIDNALVTDISDSFVDGSVDLNLDRAVKLAGSFTVRNPGQVIPYRDYLAVFLRREFDDGSETAYDQIGLYATSVPPGTSTIEEAVGTFAGADLTSVLGGTVFSDAYNIAASTNVRTAMLAILSAAGMSRVNIPATTRTTAADATKPTGSSRGVALNDLAQGIGWYQFGTDLDGKISTPGDTRALASVQPFRTLTDSDIQGPVQTLAPGRDPSNVIVAVSEDSNHAPLSSVARNDDPASPTSTVAIGREMSPPDSPLKPNGPMTQADLDAYAARALSDARSYYHVVKFSILPDPSALIAHQVVQLSLTGANAALNGLWWVRTATQGLTPANALTSLECNRVTDDITGVQI